MGLLHKNLTIASLGVLASAASAQTVFDFSAETINSMEALGNAANEHRSVAATNNYVFGGSVNLSGGVLSEVLAATFASEARVRITHLPSGNQGTVQFSTTGDFTGTHNPPLGNKSVGGNLGGTSIAAGDVFDIEFYESFDDGPGADAFWDDLVFTSNVLVTPTATDLGTIGDTSSDYLIPDLTFTTTGGAIQWYRFNIAQDVLDANGVFLDIDSEGSNFDTEIGLFRSNGALVASDDDDGSGTQSQLSFGQTAPTRPIGTSVGGNGRDGGLTAGTYYLAIGGFNTTFGGGFGASTTSTNTTGTFTVNFRTNAVPEPATMAVLGLGALALVRRRRK